MSRSNKPDSKEPPGGTLAALVFLVRLALYLARFAVLERAAWIGRVLVATAIILAIIGSRGLPALQVVALVVMLAGAYLLYREHHPID